MSSAPSRAASIFKAVFIGDADLLSMILGEGADVNQVDEQGSTPLHIAAAQGIFLNFRKPKSLTFRSAHFDCVKMLLEKGATVNALNKQAQTPLHVALLSGATEVIRFLLRQGANIHVRLFNRSHRVL